MPIQLDKILADIAEEKALHPNYPNATKKQADDAWMRVGKNNKLSVHECRSIFKVLQKKYEQERTKEQSAWKLFNVMDEIHKKVEIKAEVKQEADGEPEIPMEDDEEYEMLEVQEEEEQTAAVHNNSSTSDNESPNKSMKSSSSTDSPEKEEKPLLRTLAAPTPKSATPIPPITPHMEDRKILNSMPSAGSKVILAGVSTPQTPSAATAAALQKKGITMKKTTPTTPACIAKITGASITPQGTIKTTPARGGNSLLEVGKTIQLPESIKRKLSEDHITHTPVKRSNLSQATSTSPIQQQLQTTAAVSHNQQTSQAATSPPKVAVKTEREPETTHPAHGINLITIPANPTRSDMTNGTSCIGSGSLIGAGPPSSAAATVASTSTNGFSPRLEEIDFRNDIIFDAGNGHASGINGDIIGARQQSINRVNHSSDIINLGNFDNSLPPTFFKNLCNSSRHEALGLYVANVMNRLGTRSAARLELGILRAIIDVQSDELEQ